MLPDRRRKVDPNTTLFTPANRHCDSNVYACMAVVLADSFFAHHPRRNLLKQIPVVFV